MHWYDADGARCDEAFKALYIDVEGVGFGVAEDNLAARLRDRLRRCDPGMRSFRELEGA